MTLNGLLPIIKPSIIKKTLERIIIKPGTPSMLISNEAINKITPDNRHT